MYLRTFLLLLCATTVHANLPPLDGPRIYVRIHTAEINTYGSKGNEQTCVLFRNSAGMILDWRWWNKPSNWAAAQSARDGIIDGNYLLWTEATTGRIVRFKHLRYSRTLHDVELRERQIFPEHERVPIFKR
jgi:hypothetical protein